MKPENDSDKKRWMYNYQKFVDKYYDLHNNLNFPPLTLYKNATDAYKYKYALTDAYLAGENLPEIDFITGDAKPFDEFEEKFRKEIAEAKKFRIASGENAKRALDLYAKQTGEELHESEYMELFTFTP